MNFNVKKFKIFNKNFKYIYIYSFFKIDISSIQKILLIDIWELETLKGHFPNP